MGATFIGQKKPLGLDARVGHHKGAQGAKGPALHFTFLWRTVREID